LGDRKKAVAEPDANLLREGSQVAGAEAILGLQQTHGNAYVQRLLKSRAVQAKLTVNPPDDQYEREADQVAETVTKTTNVQREAQPEEEEEKVQAKLQRQAVPEEEEEEKLQTKLQRQEDPDEEEERVASEEEGEEEEKLQKRAVASAVPEVAEGLEERINAARGSGQALPDSLRSSIEPRLGHDFSRVRLHTDAEADGLSQQLGAKAFTTGQDVFFRRGNYQPDAQEGVGLISHELTHVVQQGVAPVSRKSPGTGTSVITEPGRGGPAEAEEDAVAQKNGRVDTLGVLQMDEAATYASGDLSQRYQGLPPAEREKVRDEVNRKFQEETGVTRRLDWTNPKDRPLARRWLRIRDWVMAGVSATSGEGPKPLSVEQPVALVPQPTNTSCWAASLAMIASWRDKRSYSADEIALAAGMNTVDGYGWPGISSAVSHWGMNQTAPASAMPRYWAELLENRGPLWVVEIGGPYHAIVLAGIRGDGTAKGTLCKVYNPWPPNAGNIENALSFEDFAEEFGLGAGAGARIVHGG
jgi:hypothetical protein